MSKKFLTSLRESPFIEGMGRIFDYFGIMDLDPVPTKSDAEALGEDWEKVLRDYNSSNIIVRDNRNDREKNQAR
jgi:hypothetical protein